MLHVVYGVGLLLVSYSGVWRYLCSDKFNSSHALFYIIPNLGDGEEKVFIMKKNLIVFLSAIFLFSCFIACENDLKMTLPQGPEGPQGKDGLSAFDLWKQVYAKDEKTTIEDFFNSLKGKDGKDGEVPIIGTNDNWWIRDVDTGIPARGKDGKNGVTPVIGENDNWWIDGRDTGVASRGKDGLNGNDGQDGENGENGKDGVNGVDGKSAYELWKEAVIERRVTEKDGVTIYEGDTSWESFLRWLQGGDISVLHQFWLKQGNEGDLNVFMEALFDCHCDNIQVIVIAPYECVETNQDNTLSGDYYATIIVTGTEGTDVSLKGSDNTAMKTIGSDETQVSFPVIRTETEQKFELESVLPNGKRKVKKVTVPALQFYKITSVEITDELLDEVNYNYEHTVKIVFDSAPALVSVSILEERPYEYLIYDVKTGTNDGWQRSQDGKTFTFTYTDNSYYNQYVYPGRYVITGKDLKNEICVHYHYDIVPTPV
ncbi:MAG TPA: hypothetical protein DEF88_12895 [Porphyromonadaceae bacterium]|nr:hypothetical protein [Porphyromonadaceae bacterium]HCM21984.1 hypothetical protein [Porphyromonadaceae bacterium]